jgi:hypothetical protein
MRSKYVATALLSLAVSALAALLVVQYSSLGDSSLRQFPIFLDEEAEPVDTIGQDDDLEKELAPIAEAATPSPCGMVIGVACPPGALHMVNFAPPVPPHVVHYLETEIAQVQNLVQNQYAQINHLVQTQYVALWKSNLALWISLQFQKSIWICTNEHTCGSTTLRSL